MALTLGLEIALAVAKVGKYASSESGDTVEVIERPHGGLSVVMADGQRSGKSAKRISNMVVRKAVSLLADGVRDGAAARAAHDYLRTHRSGQVSATLNIVSVDLDTQTLVISRNSHCPAILVNPAWAAADLPDGVRCLDDPSEPIGIYARTRPVIVELPLQANTTVVVFTDGVWSAGERYGRRLDVTASVLRLMRGGHGHPQALADRLLEEALALDEGRPADDMSLVVLAVLPYDRRDEVRRMTVSVPV